MKPLFPLICLLLVATAAYARNPTETIQTVTITDDDGPGSLRQAIVAANAAGGNEEIEFAIPNSPAIIELLSPLPPLTTAVIIDGSTEPGYAGIPVISIDGGEAGSSDGIVAQAPGCSIRNLILTGFSGSGVVLGAANGTVQGCYIGNNGSTALPNGIGVTISGTGTGASGNLIGGATAALGNTIGGNGIDVSISGTFVSSNTVYGNMIGVSADGSFVLASGSSMGVLIDGGHGNAIGGGLAGEGNTIGGYEGPAIQITNGAYSNNVAGNSIGLSASTTQPLQISEGILIDEGATGNTIGGTTFADGNDICGSSSSAIVLNNAAGGNTIEHNTIGTDRTGFNVVGNSGPGVDVENSVGTSIGANVISGNSEGIYVLSSSETTIDGNFVGTDVSGSSPLGNTGAGIEIDF